MIVGAEEGVVLGKAVGSDDGCEEGRTDGTTLGNGDGTTLGVKEGVVDGNSVGVKEGAVDGSILGEDDGDIDGTTLASTDGLEEGSTDAFLDGALVTNVGTKLGVALGAKHEGKMRSNAYVSRKSSKLVNCISIFNTLGFSLKEISPLKPPGLGSSKNALFPEDPSKNPYTKVSLKIGFVQLGLLLSAENTPFGNSSAL